MEELLPLSVKQLHQKLIDKEVSAKEITETFLAHIDSTEKNIHAFITITPELALSQAALVDKKVADNVEISELAGIPCAIKDSILVKDVRCTAASKILDAYIAPYDATVTKKLRDHDTIFIGKANTDEFNMGASTENSAYGVTKNPHDTTRVAGGSSGGSAASVAANEAVISLGADTGGSIRLPASFCGVVGVKPTYGSVSRHGLIAMSSSLDQIGPLAKTAEDAESVFQVICGSDPYDATSLEQTYKNIEANLKNIRIGVPKEYFAEGLDPKIEETIKKTLASLEKAGATLKEITLPHTQYALAAYYILNTSEISSNLARFDGIRYGESYSNEEKLFDVYQKTRGEFFGSEVKRRIMLGTYALSAGYYDAYYLTAQKIRTLLQQDFTAAFQEVDVIMGPVSPTLPFKIGEKAQDPLAMYLVDLYTVPVNLVGLPALSLPIGESEGLPIGLHIISKPLSENLLFGIAKETEKLL